MTLDELDDRTFATVPETASILEMDERSVHRAIQAGEIPSTKVGSRRLIPVRWLRAQASGGIPDAADTRPAPVVPEQIAAAVADRVVAQLARAFAAMAGAADQDGP